MKKIGFIFAGIVLSIMLASCGSAEESAVGGSINNGGGGLPGGNNGNNNGGGGPPGGNNGNNGGIPSNILYVNVANTLNSIDGSSWGNAYSDLSEALKSAKEKNNNQAGSITQIWIAAGTYIPTLAGVAKAGSDREKHFTLLKKVEIYGGFVGGETDVTKRDPSKNKVILSGDVDNNDKTDITKGGNAYHVVYTENLDETAELHGVTISSGNANGSNNDGKGGGIHNNGSSPTFKNVTIANNNAKHGAGIYNGSSNATFSNVTISSNETSSGGEGGGILNDSKSNSTFSNATISNNKNYSGYGAGIANEGSLTLINTTITKNIADSGGAIYAKNGTLSIINTIIWDNKIGSLLSSDATKLSASIKKTAGNVYVAYSTIQNATMTGTDIKDKNTFTIGISRSNVFKFDLTKSIEKHLGSHGGAVETIKITDTGPAAGVGAYIKLCASNYCFANSKASTTWTDITTGSNATATGDVLNLADARGYKPTMVPRGKSEIAMGAYNPYALGP